MITVKKLAQLAGVTPRTIRFYDEIGLLKPSQVADNGYRYYGEESLLVLQQILLYRELDLPLDQIKEIMGRHGFNATKALQDHREELAKRITRLERLVKTVDNTLLYMKGEIDMTQKQMFEPFNDEQQAEYEKEAAKAYDPEIVRQSNQKWKKYSAEDKQRIADEGNAIYQDMAGIIQLGAASEEAQACVERWRAHLNYFWTPNLEQLVGLAEMYNNDPRFKSNFDKVDSRLAEFMLAAVKEYVKRASK